MADITDKNSLVSQAAQIAVLADGLSKIQVCIDILGGPITPMIQLEGIAQGISRACRLPLSASEGLVSAREDLLLALVQAFETYRDAVERVLRSTLRSPG